MPIQNQPNVRCLRVTDDDNVVSQRDIRVITLKSEKVVFFDHLNALIRKYRYVHGADLLAEYHALADK